MLMSFIRTKKIKGHEYQYEVESSRVNGKVKQKVLKYLGRVDADKPIITPAAKNRAVSKVHKNGMAWVYAGRRLAGKSIKVTFEVLSD